MSSSNQSKRHHIRLMEVIGNSIEVKSKVKKRRYFKNIDLILRLIS